MRGSLPENTAGRQRLFLGRNLYPKISVKAVCRIKAVSIRIESLGDEHDAIIAVWLHGLRQNEAEE
jgi:hypothetical protein